MPGVGCRPATAQVLYDDGPINGTTDAWTINFGYVVADTITLAHLHRRWF